MTNREWLESLSDEEFAKFMMRADRCNYCVGDDGECFTYNKPCYKGKYMWLQAEHKEQENADK